MDKTEAIGFLFVLLITFQSIGDMCEWVSSLPYPQWVKAIGYVFALALWICGMAFLYFAEKAMRNKKKDDYE